MGKKVNRLQHLIEKLTDRYGQEDEDVKRLQSALDLSQAFKKLDAKDGPRFGPSETSFLTPAKRIFYAHDSATPH